MSIFDFLFARAATPEQAQKNIFLDAIDGGGRFASFRDVADDDPNKFRGGPLGISALLNALGVDPYGYSDAQPSSPPPRAAPVGKPARQSAPRPAATPNLVDFIAANTGLRPSTDAELTAAFDQPIPPSLIARPFDGAGFGYTAPPPVLPPAPAAPMAMTASPVGFPNDGGSLKSYTALPMIKADQAVDTTMPSALASNPNQTGTLGLLAEVLMDTPPDPPLPLNLTEKQLQSIAFRAGVSRDRALREILEATQ